MNRLLTKCVRLNALNNTKKVSSLLMRPRALATNSSELKSTTAVTDAAKELDKPQWERSDRYRIFYGFNFDNEAEDKGYAHFFGIVGMFAFIFCPLFLIYYYPDYKTNEWCYREANLVLSKREKAGLPLVDPDLVPQSSVQLPSDEEIGDMEIII